jgi:hypothetical protein
VLDLGGRLSRIEGPPPPPEDAAFGGVGIAVLLRIYLSIKQWFMPTCRQQRLETVIGSDQRSKPSHIDPPRIWFRGFQSAFAPPNNVCASLNPERLLYLRSSMINDVPAHFFISL